MSYFSQSYKCNKCGHHFDSLIKRSERENPGVECPICEANLGKEDEAFSPPNVSTRTSASRVDGLRSENSKRLIEAAHVRSDMFNQRPKDRQKHKEELRKLTGPTKKN